MDVQFYGANCISISVGGARVIIDDTLTAMGGKSVAKVGDVTLFTSTRTETAAESKLVIDRPGEYDVSGITIHGIPARAHMDEDKQHTATMYKLQAKDLRVLVTGHIFPKLKEDELEQIGSVDIMIVPVGGNGYTLDPDGALELIKEIEPKIVIPTYYADDKLSYPMPAKTLDEALQGLGMEPKDRTGRLRLKPADIGDDMQLIILEKANL